jgi:hypothetical protein
VPRLPELQRQFAARIAGRRNPRDGNSTTPDWAADDGLAGAARLRIYANNARLLFEDALRRTYPVVERRVGAAYFSELARAYRAAHPSRQGDLHEIGRSFAAFLATHLRETPYAWLAELAALEWAIADAGVAADATPVGLEALAGLEPEAVAAAVLELAPSLRVVAASVPVLSVWRANQGSEDGAPTDLAAGAEYVVLHRDADGDVALRGCGAAEHVLVAALASGESLAAAIERAALPLAELPGALGRLFAAGAVARVRPCSHPGDP